MRSVHPWLRCGGAFFCALILMGQAPASGRKGKAPLKDKAPLETTATQTPPRPHPTVHRFYPTTAEPGERVTIELANASDVIVRSVKFGDLDATMKSNKGGLLWVVVPDGLKAGEKPPIVIDTPVGTAYFTDFIVTREPLLTIVSVTPAKALPGGSVRLELNRTLKETRDRTLLFGAAKAEFRVSDRSVETIVPRNAEIGQMMVVLFEGPNAARYPIEILERKVLGIPQTWLSRGLPIVIGVLLLLAVSIGYIWSRERAARLTDRLDAITRFDERKLPADAESDWAPPAVPEALVHLCASGKCILFAGPGLGAQSRLPTQHEALLQIVSRADLPNKIRQQLSEALENDELAFVSEVIESQIDRKDLIAQLTQLYAIDRVDLSEAHVFLREIQFAGVLTSAWDRLIDATFAKKSPVAIRGEADAEQAFQQDAFFVARLRGALDAPSTIVFSSAEYQRTFYARPAFARVVASQVMVHPLFFVGMSLTGIDEFFSAFRFPPRSIQWSYAIVPYAPLWESQQQRFRANYGVELIGYDPTNRHEQMVEFLGELEERVRALPEAEAQPGKLRRIRLENIGAFESLEISDLKEHWNVLLGNNGAGKSTILRAIALGLCGDDPEAAIGGSYLLRHSAREGSIELQVGDAVYRTELRRVGSRVLTTAQYTLPQKGGLLTLGFPALRGISQRDPSGPSAIWSTEPRIGDLLPLIRGTIDTRIDSLKQWLVNLEVNSTPGVDVSRREAAANRARTLAFYAILQKFTPGQQVQPGRIDRSTWQVYVKTEDGDVPIDHVSQGMSSIFGWVGTLIQRMYEVQSGAGAPTQQPALVLVDEIDAHLHPEWQLQLTSIVNEHFPNVQIIATTHSPLLVAGMKQDELLIAHRDPAEPSRIEVFRSMVDPEGMRADQILTSPIFGLVSTRGPQTNAEMRRLSVLAGMARRTPEQDRELGSLEAKLAYIFRAGETRQARLHQWDEYEKVNAEIRDYAEQITNADESVKAEARKRFSQLFGGPE
jgi:hypothetical protein